MEKTDSSEPSKTQTSREAENRIRFFDWFDQLPLFHREFINDYGFALWFQLRDQMNGSTYAFELKLKSYRQNHPPLPVTGAVE